MCKQQVKKPARTLKLTVDAETGLRFLTIRVGKQIDLYWLSDVPTPLDGRVFKLDKFGSADSYHVVLTRGEQSCDCMGHLRWGHCKHASAALKLCELGKV